MRTSLATVTFLFAAVAAPAFAEEARTSRHVYRGNDSGTAERLAQPRTAGEPVRVVKTQPLGERGTSSRTVAASNLAPTSQVIASGSTYEVQVRQPTASVQPQQFVNAPPPANQDRTRVDNNARILAASASPEYRIAVDRNARVVRNYAIYQEQQQPQVQPEQQPEAQQQQPEAQSDANFVSVPQASQPIAYGNTYGTYTQPVTYAVAQTNYYPVSYAPAYCPPTYSYATYYRPSYSYCAPTYYRPSYSYCAPTYYAPRYYSSGYCAPRYYAPAYCAPRYSGYVGYSSYGGYCGPRYGGYGGYRSGGYYGSSYGGYVGYSSGGRCGGGSSWAFGFRF